MVLVGVSMKYIIDDYQLIKAGEALYLGNYGIGAKITNQNLANLLLSLQKQEKLEISEADLKALAHTHNIVYEQLVNALLNKLKIIQVHSPRKFSTIYINSDDEMITELLKESFDKEYAIEICHSAIHQYQENTLVIFYRKNYSNHDFKALYQHLPKKVYAVTAGIVHKVLIIDNLYYVNSGLPTHFSNLNQLLACVHNDVSITKNNWLLFYRKLMQSGSDQFPDPEVSGCQRGYIAYSLQRFASQYTNFWKLPTTLDEINWFWHVDLTSFSVTREVAIHSPYSEYDMGLNLKTKQVTEAV